MNKHSYCCIVKIWICKIYLCMRNTKTLTTFFSSGTKRLLLFLTYSFSTRGERDTIFYYADCSYIVLQSTLSWMPGPESKSQLTSPRVKSQLTVFFQNHPNSQLIASRHDVIHTLVPFSIWVFLLWHMWLSYPSVRAWTPALRAE